MDWNSLARTFKEAGESARFFLNSSLILIEARKQVSRFRTEKCTYIVRSNNLTLEDLDWLRSVNRLVLCTVSASQLHSLLTRQSTKSVQALNCSASVALSLLPANQVSENFEVDLTVDRNPFPLSQRIVH